MNEVRAEIQSLKQEIGRKEMEINEKSNNGVFFTTKLCKSR